jgi:glycosyltransferase involved in cell wall biosynthesis
MPTPVDQESPRLSILTPSYGYGRFIGQAIDSCRNQGFDDYEHLIQDACSTVETDAVVSAAGSERIRYVREPDGGQSDALNRALHRARGEWIGWLNADEYYLPGAFEAVLAAADRSGADVVFGDCVFVDVAGRPLRLVPSHPHSRFVLRNYGPFIHSCATFIRRAAVPDGGWDTGFRRMMDWDLWLRLDRARFEYIPTTLAAFRIHPDQVTATDHSAGDVAELHALRRKHGISGTAVARAAGRLGHAGLKVASGGYLRQLRAAYGGQTAGSVSAARRRPSTTRE